MAAFGLSSWSALGGPFLSSFAQMSLENGLVAMYCTASISGSEAIFLLSRSNHWPRAVTIVDSGCGLSQECARGGCNGTCVKLEASKLT